MKRITLLFSIFLLTFLATHSVYAERDVEYTITDLHVKIYVDEMGHLHIEEDFTYDVSFINGIIRGIETTGTDGISYFRAYDITDPDNALELYYEQTGSDFRIFQESEDELKTFRIHYTLDNVVTAYNDVADLYHKLYDESNTERIDRVTADVYLPYQAEEQHVNVFGHGPTHGSVQIHPEGFITYEVDPLPPNEMLEIRVLFPPEWVPLSSKTISENQFASIMDEELGWAAKQQRNQIYSKTLLSLFFIFSFGTVIIMILHYLSRRHITFSNKKYVKSPPSKRDPISMSALLQKNPKPNSNMMYAVVLDLVRRGYIEMHENLTDSNKNNSFYFSIINPKRLVELQDHEAQLVKLLFYDSGQNGIFNGAYVSEQLRLSNEFRRIFRKGFKEWQLAVKIFIQDNQLLNRPTIMSIMLIGWGLAGTLISILLFFYDNDLMAIMALPGVVLSLYFLTSYQERIYLLSKDMKEEVRDWQLFKHYLTNFSNLNERPTWSIAIWEHFLCMLSRWE
ncbi:DUF2207 domain-containing protein [Bacillus sp. JCM 19034]|uniref:DUF2207 domain-containing protein n=1 Tax=Bacillus sp. JCM 19034 TaxID=1481928 RepID=UPI0007853FE8|nr:DUF2207 domain-containing protein [Bacillus sp. JCM 19034]